MEEQRASLADILLHDPTLDVEAAVDDLRRAINEAVRQVDPAASVAVELHSDWVSIDPEAGSRDPATQAAVLAALYAAKEHWFLQLNEHLDLGSADGEVFD